MRGPYARPLNSPDLVEDFLTNTLQYGGYELDDVIPKIVKGELGLAQIERISPTLHDSSFRNRSCKSDSDRWKLRMQIVDELFTFKRLEKDDDIRLGNGGALPQTEIKNEGQAYIITGLPASGKSTISSKIADFIGATILDSDYAKRKLPEFYCYEFGGAVVHEESDNLIFGYTQSDKPDSFLCLWDRCTQIRQNICIPKIGYDAESILKMALQLKKFNYEVHLILVSLDRRKATIRAINRYLNTSRYVSLALIFDGYANDPDIAYTTLRDKNKKKRVFKSMGHLSTDVPLNTPPKIIDSVGSCVINDIR